ncbi:plastocyanin/azurin family copper-binding protein [Cohnella yongneupensis]|uniref:Plastocyanin/azurin family copper-binding protein n=1 Tax=Cohnella yongneupensis TaxID=425006 RepID=A0ABW0R6K7_9BACL
MTRTTSGRWIAMMTIALILFAMTACGNKNTNDTSASPIATHSASPAGDDASASPTSSASESPSPSASESPSPSASESPSPSASATASHEVEHEHGDDDSPSASASASATPSESPSPSPSASNDSGDDDASKEVVVEIKGYAFSTADLKIKKGTTVTFINRDKVKHSATADDGSFDTGLIAQDESAQVKFDTVGTFTYFCKPHNYMTATITVTKD